MEGIRRNIKVDTIFRYKSFRIINEIFKVPNKEIKITKRVDNLSRASSMGSKTCPIAS